MSWIPLKPRTFALSYRRSATNCVPTPAASELEAVQSSFDTELKEYRDKTREQIQRLRREVQAAAAAVESFAGSINESEVNLESPASSEN